MSKVAWLFPGQGAQVVGMGQDVVEASSAAREIFAEADRILDIPVSSLCFDGPEESLAATDVQQPAIFTVSAALLAAMREAHSDLPSPDFAAGLSLGEYTALYAAGAFDFETALKLLRLRGQLMQQASEENPGSMVAVIGLDDAQVEDLVSQAAQGQVLGCANYNCPGQVVVSGEVAACDRLVELAVQAGARAAEKLTVAGAFHSPLMSSAAEKLRVALDEARISEPGIPVIANVDMEFHGGADAIRDRLCRQLCSSTYWCQSMQKLIAADMSRGVEIGPKKTLSSMMRRIDRTVKVQSVADAASVASTTIAAGSG